MVSLCVFYVQYEKNESYDSSFEISDIKNHQKNTMKKVYGMAIDCKSIPISTSQGLIMDSAIVCNATKDIPADKLPVFYYEDFPQNPVPHSYLFVNLDYTDFRKLIHDARSPKNILCKTKQTYDILKNVLPPHKNIIYTGFTSIDRYDPSIPKNMKGFIHIPGKSPNKGTEQVIEAWTKSKDWPTLTLICRDELYEELSKKFNMKNLKNINVINTFLEEAKLYELMNKNGVHVCTSKGEGFGHYLNEARSTQAVVLYTDAPPMNEMFNDMTGISVKAKLSRTMNDGMCPTYSVTIDSIKESVEKVLGKSEAELSEIGKRARDAYLNDDKMFKERLMRLFN
jgi:hypothetical protein